jgi:hypothetical protein
VAGGLENSLADSPLQSFRFAKEGYTILLIGHEGHDGVDCGIHTLDLVYVRTHHLFARHVASAYALCQLGGGEEAQLGRAHTSGPKHEVHGAQNTNGSHEPRLTTEVLEVSVPSKGHEDIGGKQHQNRQDRRRNGGHGYPFEI